MNKTIYGVDLTTNNPTLMEIQSCMTSRYDAGICKHMKERTGVIEIIKVDSMYENNTIAKSRAEQSRAEQLKECRLGNLHGATGGSFAGQIYDKDYLSPTLTDMQGGGRQPHIVEIEKMNVEKLGYIEKGTGGGNVPLITNDKPILVGGLGNEKEFGNQFRQGNHVYDSNGIAMALTAQPVGNMGGNSYLYLTEERLDEKQIVAMRGRNPENPSDRTAGIHLEQRLEPNSENMCNTLTSVQKDNLVLEKKTIKIKQATKDGFVECEIPGIADLNYVSSTTRRGRVQENGKMCPTLCAENVPSLIELGNPDFYNFLYCIDGQIYLIRIRKLIPLECWRLMGFTDEDFHKAEKVNSNTQLYKQAGNSIVKNCLTAIYKQML